MARASTGRLLVLCAVWLTLVVGGLGALARYATLEGPAAAAPATWPVASTLSRAADRATLLFFAHPQCPCTRASLAELARALARRRGPVDATALFVRPEGAPADWDDTGLVRAAREVVGLRVLLDDRGREAARFGAATSGQTLVYDAAGDLVFGGGLTMSRGHEGDNPGRAALEAALAGAKGSRESPVFGCALVEGPWTE